MTLSRRGDYVMRSALALARAFPSDRSRKIREIVEETEIPSTFASQVLADLVRAELASSRAGRDGGYRLRRDPSEISVLEVIEAAEGPLHAERCALGEGPCRWESICPLHETWAKATATLRKLLAGTSLAEVAARDQAIEAGTYVFAGASHRAHPVEVEISDRVEVETSFAEAERGLGALGGSLARIVASAVRPDPAKTSAGARGVAAEATLTAVGGGRARDGSRYRLEGQVLAAVETIRIEADLTLRAIDAERCELSVSGTWHQESPREPRRAAELEDHARRALRRILRSLARALDTPARRAAIR